MDTKELLNVILGLVKQAPNIYADVKYLVSLIVEDKAPSAEDFKKINQIISDNSIRISNDG